MSRDQLNILFKQYEVAFNTLDLETISGYCADTIQSAGPQGITSPTKKDFLDKAVKSRDLYKRIGRKSACIISQRMVPICERYTGSNSMGYWIWKNGHKSYRIRPKLYRIWRSRTQDHTADFAWGWRDGIEEIGVSHILTPLHNDVIVCTSLKVGN